MIDKSAFLVYIGVLVVVVGWLLYSVWLVLVAVLVVLVPAMLLLAVPVIVSVALCPFARVGMVHTPLLKDPTDGVATAPINCEGMMSWILTLVAVSGPLFRAVTIYVTIFPTFTGEFDVWLNFTSAFLT